MKMAFEYDCGKANTPQNSENLMNIVRAYPAKYTCSKVLDHKEPVHTGYVAASCCFSKLYRT